MLTAAQRWDRFSISEDVQFIIQRRCKWPASSRRRHWRYSADRDRRSWSSATRWRLRYCGATRRQRMACNQWKSTGTSHSCRVIYAGLLANSASYAQLDRKWAHQPSGSSSALSGKVTVSLASQGLIKTLTNSAPYSQWDWIWAPANGLRQCSAAGKVIVGLVLQWTW